MSPRYAARIDANQRDVVAALRGVGAAVLPLFRLGSDAPDLLAFHPATGRWALLEVKNPVRGRRAAEQHDDWPARTGFPVATVWAIDEALAAVGVSTAARSNER